MRECVQDYIEKVKKDYLRKLEIYERKYFDGEIRIKGHIYGSPGLLSDLRGREGLEFEDLTNAEKEAINTYRYYEITNREKKIEKRKIRTKKKPVISKRDILDRLPHDILEKIQDGNAHIDIFGNVQNDALALYNKVESELEKEALEKAPVVEVIEEVQVDYTYIKLFNKVTPKLSDEEFWELAKYSQITNTSKILDRLDELEKTICDMIDKNGCRY